MPSALKETTELTLNVEEHQALFTSRLSSPSSQPPASPEFTVGRRRGLPLEADQLINEAEWNALVSKGANLVEQMRQSIAATPASPFVEFDQIMENGWRRPYRGVEVGNPVSFNVLAAELRGTGVLDGVERDATIGTSHAESRGKYTNIYSPEESLLAAFYNDSPESKRGIDTERYPLPILQHWSDISFLIWQEESRRKGLKLEAPRRVLRVKVQNDDTFRVLNTVLSRSPNVQREESDTSSPLSYPSLLFKVPAWPGITLGIDDDNDAAKALLATPNGVGVAWLLIDHKPQFGIQSVKEVTIFECGGIFMLFRIEDG